MNNIYSFPMHQIILMQHASGLAKPGEYLYKLSSLSLQKTSAPKESNNVWIDFSSFFYVLEVYLKRNTNKTSVWSQHFYISSL